MNNVAQRYAEALFELASEKNKIDLWQEQMDVVGESIGSNPRILEILKHSKIDSKDKKDILEKCFSLGLINVPNGDTYIPLRVCLEKYMDREEAAELQDTMGELLDEKISEFVDQFEEL